MNRATSSKNSKLSSVDKLKIYQKYPTKIVFLPVFSIGLYEFNVSIAFKKLKYLKIELIQLRKREVFQSLSGVRLPRLLIYRDVLYRAWSFDQITFFRNSSVVLSKFVLVEK